mgnify:CR=1 FL=1
MCTDLDVFDRIIAKLARGGVEVGRLPCIGGDEDREEFLGAVENEHVALVGVAEYPDALLGFWAYDPFGCEPVSVIQDTLEKLGAEGGPTLSAAFIRTGEGRWTNLELRVAEQVVYCDGVTIEVAALPRHGVHLERVLKTAACTKRLADNVRRLACQSSSSSFSSSAPSSRQ